ncbi:Wadjet anti-phage system protein JetD domain-containing protein [Virgibacillus flavescens]|uniref:Wadjet anti-phage system protein JetD domain-containing protein n=1 Tax=Virgibacillus flavescens TaxID=1611422 RepID=UPI003D326906
MERLVREILIKEQKKTIEIINLEQKVKKNLGENRSPLFYKEFAEIVLQLEENGVIIPLKSAQSYGPDSRIKEKYKKCEEVKRGDEEELKNEIFSFHPSMVMREYLKDLNKYRIERDVLKIISSFLVSKSSSEPFYSVNERSYQLFGNEKFLASKAGKQILQLIGKDYDDLCCFETYEPFFHFGKWKNEGEAILIVENKDTFFSVKKLMLEGIDTWDGKTFTMLVYGEGNKISHSIDYLKELNIPTKVPIYYFGDLDREGVSILYRTSQKDYKVQPMIPFYRAIWKNRRNKKGKSQNWNEASVNFFLSYMDKEIRGDILQYLKKGQYIPQEALSIEQLRRMSNWK